MDTNYLMSDLRYIDAHKIKTMEFFVIERILRDYTGFQKIRLIDMQVNASIDFYDNINILYDFNGGKVFVSTGRDLQEIAEKVKMQYGEWKARTQPENDTLEFDTIIKLLNSAQEKIEALSNMTKMQALTIYSNINTVSTTLSSKVLEIDKNE